MPRPQADPTTMIVAILVILLALPPRYGGAFALVAFVALMIHRELRWEARAPGRRSLVSGTRLVAAPAPGLPVLEVGRGRRRPIAPTALGGALIVVGVLAVAEALTFDGAAAGLESLKMPAAGCALLAGSTVVMSARSQHRLHVVLSVSVMVPPIFAYLVGAVVDISVPGRDLVSVPSGNHAAILICVLAPVAVAPLRDRHATLYLICLGLFGLSIASRIAIAVLVVLMAFRWGRDRLLRLAAVIAAAVALLALDVRGLSFGGFSDQLRREIWSRSIDRILERRLILIGQGEAAFVEELNATPFYRTLEVAHAHNLVLHIWNSYGLIVLAVWVWALGRLLCSLRGTGRGVSGQVLAFASIAQIEALITDSRVTFIVLFVLGVRLRSARDEFDGSGELTLPDSAQRHRGDTRA